MTTEQAVSQLIASAPRPAGQAPPASARIPRLAGRRARVSRDDAADLPFNSAYFVVSPPDAESQWRMEELDSYTLSRMTPAELVELLADLSPEVSRALWDFCRMFNPGWECRALRPSGRVDGRGQAALDAFWALLGDLYISPDVVLNAMIVAGFLRGAFAAELVLDEQGWLPVDLATPDPYSFRFRKIDDPLRGAIYQPGQWQGGKFVPLDMPTVAYVPIDKFPNSPYGRSPALPALFAAIFLLGMLHDLRRVIQQQGYPRLDLAVKMELLREAMPGDLGDDPEKFRQWIDAIIEEIGTVYSSLEPDDAYVHTDMVEVNRPVGTVDAGSLGAVDGLITGLERMITRALKTMPLLMGLQEGGSETHANRQWELHAAGVKAIQHLLESLLERLLTVMLQAQGIQVAVEFRFAELRASEMLRDAQTEAIQIANASAQYEAGWISQDEAALKGAGKEKADEEQPRRTAQPAIEPVQGDGDGEPAAGDESRWLQLWALEQTVEELGRKMAEMRGRNGHG